jgi:hypothetical protein
LHDPHYDPPAEHVDHHQPPTDHDVDDQLIDHDIDDEYDIDYYDLGAHHDHPYPHDDQYDDSNHHYRPDDLHDPGTPDHDVDDAAAADPDDVSAGPNPPRTAAGLDDGLGAAPTGGRGVGSLLPVSCPS